MLSEDDCLGVAVSGGADSVVLLHILHALSGALSLQLTVLHINHKLRGADSDADEEFVRRLAEFYNIPILVQHGSPPRTGNLEQEARRIRQAFFRQVRQDCNLRGIALGHTQTDQAETVLFRLLRGSGPTGLAAMPFVSKDGLIRPLLTTSREEVREFAEQNQITWRDDPSNHDLRFARNRLRLKTIPELARDFNPSLRSVLAGTANIACEEENYWHRVVERTFRQLSQRTYLGITIELKTFKKLHLALRRRVMRRAIKEVRGTLQSVDLSHVDSILSVSESLHGHDRVIIPGLDALRSFDHLLLCRPGALQGRPGYNFDIQLGTTYQLPFGGGELKIIRTEPDDKNCVNFKNEQDFLIDEAHLSSEALATVGLQVRNWEPGDRLLRVGHTTAEKVKTLFQDYKVLLWERRYWPVVVVGSEIVWVRRFGVAANFSVSDESRWVLRILYRP
ncbi:MAG: tRNA lysidine(34) synthetase TilS [Acidobacteriaceae bacterium]|nr:tRNA lysidine(34) synthetase TilS [Acidobacteriaceae bacterium]